MFNNQQGVYYPRSVVQVKPVETETIAKDLSKISTVSNSDIQAVLGDIAGVMHTRMSQGKSEQLEWIEFSPDTKDQDPAPDDDESPDSTLLMPEFDTLFVEQP